MFGIKFNVTDLALSKLKDYLKENEDGVIGFYVVLDKKEDELKTQKVFNGDIFLTKEEFEKTKKLIQKK